MNPKLKLILIGLKQFKAYRQFTLLSEEEKAVSQIPDQFVSDILELGPTFVKLGQIFGTRPDVLPVQYISALGELQEHVPVLAT
jgi:predicted unusual protein kinase regulating ubiquinone biosynthesis (AarF/ABC1/UbiB family)